MPKKRDPLPEEARNKLEAIERALIDALGQSPLEEIDPDPVELAREAVHAVRVESERNRLSEREATPVDFGAVVASRVRELRAEAGWTQAAVGEAMARLGFPWKRITVAEVELGTRRLSLEEMIGVSALFGVPVIRLLQPARDQHVVLPSGRSLPPELVTALLIGDDEYGSGAIGRGGDDWTVARQAALVVGRDDWRPARDLWAKRSSRFEEE